MTLYIGVDLHPHQQTVCWCDTETGETDMVELFHKEMEKVRKYYASFDQPAIIGIEAGAPALWFEEMVGIDGTHAACRRFVQNSQKSTDET